MQKECCFRSLKGNSHRKIPPSVSQSQKGALRLSKVENSKGHRGKKEARRTNNTAKRKMPTIPQLRNGELPFEKALGMKCMQKETKLIYPQRDGKKKQTSTFPDGCLTCPMLIVAEAFY